MFRRLAGLIGYLSDSPVRTGMATALAILLFSLLEFGLHLGLARLGIPPLVDAGIDASLVGCSVGLALWMVLVAIRHRRVQVRNELRQIEELNHEIRNALQIITHCQFDAEPQRREMVLESVERVANVLKRVFPRRAD